MEILAQLLDEIEDSAVCVAVTVAKSRNLILSIAWLSAVAVALALLPASN